MRSPWGIVIVAGVVMALAIAGWVVLIFIDARRLRRRMREIMTPEEIKIFDRKTAESFDRAWRDR